MLCPLQPNNSSFHADINKRAIMSYCVQFQTNVYMRLLYTAPVALLGPGMPYLADSELSSLQPLAVTTVIHQTDSVRHQASMDAPYRHCEKHIPGTIYILSLAKRGTVGSFCYGRSAAAAAASSSAAAAAASNLCNYQAAASTLLSALELAVYTACLQLSTMP
jgi:hypothetical protein